MPGRTRRFPGDDKRIGVGVVYQELQQVEAADEVLRRAEEAVQLLGADRVLLGPDCGFATFADNPIASAAVAKAKPVAITAAPRTLLARHGGLITAAHRE